MEINLEIKTSEKSYKIMKYILLAALVGIIIYPFLLNTNVPNIYKGTIIEELLIAEENGTVQEAVKKIFPSETPSYEALLNPKAGTYIMSLISLGFKITHTKVDADGMDVYIEKKILLDLRNAKHITIVFKIKSGFMVDAKAFISTEVW